MQSSANSSQQIQISIRNETTFSTDSDTHQFRQFNEFDLHIHETQTNRTPSTPRWYLGLSTGLLDSDPGQN